MECLVPEPPPRPRLEVAENSRLSEEAYTLADAVVVGSMLITLLRHCDRVTSACLAQLVNTIAPIRTEPAGASWRQTIFYPFALTARHAKGDVLRVEPKAPTYHSSAYGDVPVIDAIATRDPESGDATIFAVNRHQREPVRLRVSTSPDRCDGASCLHAHQRRPVRHEHGGSPRSSNSYPIQVVSEHKTLQVELAPVAWTCIRLATRPR